MGAEREMKIQVVAFEKRNVRVKEVSTRIHKVGRRYIYCVKVRRK